MVPIKIIINGFFSCFTDYSALVFHPNPKCVTYLVEFLTEKL
jgi:hypothetical protein